MPLPIPASPNLHLPPHLRKVCDLLARGLLRLRSRTPAECTDIPTDGRERGDVRLHFTAQQRPYANPNRKGVA